MSRLGSFDPMSTFELRPIDVSDEGAVSNLLALRQAVETHDRSVEVTTRADLDELFEQPSFDPAQDQVVVQGQGGGLLGWAHASHRPSDQGQSRVLLAGGVLAEHRRQGIGRALLTWAEQRGRQLLKDRADHVAGWLLVDANEWQNDRRQLHMRMGFEEARWFVVMKRPLDTVEAAAVPQGISIVPWTSEHTATVREVNGAAFADHWGSAPLDQATWDHLIDAALRRLDLSFVALDGDRIVAYSLNDAFPESDPAGERMAWIGSLGTLREYRGRGIAGSLLQHSHAAFAAAGFTHAILDVDADSPSNAGAIYTSHGYEPIHRTLVSSKVLPAQVAGKPA